MSEDLFVTGEGRTSARSRQSSLVVASAAIHAAAIAGIVLASIVLPGVLPTPRSAALAWPSPPMVRLADIPLPPRPAAARPRPTTTPNPLATPSTPVVAPTGFAQETDPATGSRLGDPGGIDVTPFAGIGDVGGAVLEPPPPVRERVREAMRLHAGIEAPRRVRGVMPIYPALARSTGAHGVVIIEATIDERGDVVAAKVLRSIPLLDAAALDAVRQWKYTPARLNGEPVAVLITVTVNFTLAAP